MMENTNAPGDAGGDEDNFTDDMLAEQQASPPLSSTPEPEPATETDSEPAEGQEPEQPETADAEPVADGEKRKYVPHAKFHEQLQRNKELVREKELVEQRTNQLLSMLQQQVGRQAPQAEQPPAEDPMPSDDDPVGQLKWLKESYVKDRQVQQERQQQTEAQAQYQRDYANWSDKVTQATKSDVETAQAEDPQFMDAYKYLMQSRAGELMATGQVTKQQAEETIKREELQIYADALNRGQRPSDVIRRYAQARGYRPGAAAAPTEQPAGPTEERRQQHRSLSQLSGKEGLGAITAKDLANMNEDDFAKLPEKLFTRLMGA